MSAIARLYFREVRNRVEKQILVSQGQTEEAAGDTALSAITTTGAMIHGRTHLGMSWWAINHQCCKTSVCTKTKPGLCSGVC